MARDVAAFIDRQFIGDLTAEKLRTDIVQTVAIVAQHVNIHRCCRMNQSPAARANREDTMTGHAIVRYRFLRHILVANLTRALNRLPASKNTIPAARARP